MPPGCRGGAVVVTDDRVARLEALYRDEYDGMVRLAFTIIGNTAEAEEIVQDSLIEVFRRYDDIRQPGAYLRCAVISRCRTALHRRRTAPIEMIGTLDLSHEAGELWDVLEKLTGDQRIVVVLRYYGGYRAAEIASMVGMPAATVRSHLHRALALLKKELAS